ncbi:MAG: CCA tRNA nucleotidyltransferase [Treponema sp.]|jgi:tRNA nucleotidyltransferase/poly(A) polymerase|nr:CCA tRNA nucleotidyltransferase [Treponema sp.]
MGNVRVHPLLKEIAALFISRGKRLYLVGGAVRDLLRGRPASDWDLATDARPEEVMAIFRNTRPPSPVIPTGIKHGTVTVHYRGKGGGPEKRGTGNTDGTATGAEAAYTGLEITTFRTESGYSDGRRPENVVFASSIEEDLSRRDFTMNAAAVRLPGGEIIDPFDGRADIQRRIIRCVGNPAERFAEDGLRPLRAVRFAAQLGFTVDRATLDAARGALDVTAKVSAERVRDELDKILASGTEEAGTGKAGTEAARPSTAFRLMEETGLLRLILPELAACRGVEQKGYHRFDVLDHCLLACDYASKEGWPREVILAALLHDAGKPATAAGPYGDGSGKREWTFYRHEEESSRLAREILTRLRYPGAVAGTVCRLIEEHMFHYDEGWSDAAVRRFIIRTGEENLENLYRLRRADAFAAEGAERGADFLLPLAERVDRALAERKALSLKDLAVSGKDLMEAGIQPGKTMGIILKELLETVIDDPESNSREKLLAIAANLARRYSSSDS